MELKGPFYRNVFKPSEKRVGKETDVDIIVTPYTHDFSPSLTVGTGGGCGLLSEWKWTIVWKYLDMSSI